MKNATNLGTLRCFCNADTAKNGSIFVQVCDENGNTWGTPPIEIKLDIPGTSGWNGKIVNVTRARIGRESEANPYITKWEIVAEVPLPRP